MSRSRRVLVIDAAFKTRRKCGNYVMNARGLLRNVGITTREHVNFSTSPECSFLYFLSIRQNKRLLVVSDATINQLKTEEVFSRRPVFLAKPGRPRITS